MDGLQRVGGVSGTEISARSLFRDAYRLIPFKVPMYRAVRHLPVPQRVYQHLHFDGVFSFALFEGGQVRMRSHGHVVENELFWRGRGGAEPTSLRLWERLARRVSGQILDIGANTGVFACVAKVAAPNARVTAFEPLSRVARWLRENVDLNGGGVIVIEKAVSDRSGTAQIHDSADPSSDVNCYSASLENAFDFNTVTYEIPTMALDDWVEPDAPVGLIKLDVECHEPAALRGMQRVLKRDRPAVLIEILNDEIGREASESFEGLDYNFYQVDEQRGLIASDRLAPLGGTDRNNLAIPVEMLKRIDLDGLMAGRMSA